LGGLVAIDIGHLLKSTIMKNKKELELKTDTSASKTEH
jgi:hypothetical protein